MPSNKLYEDDDCVAFADLNPQAPVHVLVIPKRHISSLAQIQEVDATVLGRLIVVCAQIAHEQGLDQGYRVVANTGQSAGQTVFHLHFHVLGGRAFHWPPG